jgi:hypothetical protein
MLNGLNSKMCSAEMDKTGASTVQADPVMACEVKAPLVSIDESKFTSIFKKEGALLQRGPPCSFWGLCDSDELGSII